MTPYCLPLSSPRYCCARPLTFNPQGTKGGRLLYIWDPSAVPHPFATTSDANGSNLFSLSALVRRDALIVTRPLASVY